MMRYALFLIFFIVASVNADAETIEVPGDYPTIQDAIGAAIAGDIVLVYPGTYFENIDFLGKAISIISQAGAEKTIIDGMQMASTVTLRNEEGIDSVLDGFTVTNGRAGSSYPSGGGICCCDGSVTLLNNIITANSTFSKDTGVGGGILGDAVVAINNRITRNVADSGGGAWIANGSLLVNNVISENTATDQGGGIALTSGDSRFYHNKVVNNRSSKGGGVYVLGNPEMELSGNLISGNAAVLGGGLHLRGSFKFANNIITHNTADKGGGFSAWGLSDPQFSNNTLYKNQARRYGGGYYGTNTSFARFNNCIFWDNEALHGPEIYLYDNFVGVTTLIIRYSNVKGGEQMVDKHLSCHLNWGPGMIDSDPMFANPEGGDFHLLFGSLCIDAGDSSRVVLPVDFEDDPRIANQKVDIGADEFHEHLYYTGEAFPGAAIESRIIGRPSVTVNLIIGSGVLDRPVPTQYGPWYLEPPMGSLGIWSIPYNGLLLVPGEIPIQFPVPGSIPMQALVAQQLTNLCVIEVE